MEAVGAKAGTSVRSWLTRDHQQGDCTVTLWKSWGRSLGISENRISLQRHILFRDVSAETFSLPRHILFRDISSETFSLQRYIFRDTFSPEPDTLRFISTAGQARQRILPVTSILPPLTVVFGFPDSSSPSTGGFASQLMPSCIS